MSAKVEIDIPGSGKKWTLAHELYTWVSENTPGAKILWHNLHSDRGYVTFVSGEDALVFKLRFPQWT